MPANSPDMATSAAPAQVQALRPTGDDFPVIGIGASAGGLEACRNLLAGLPSDSRVALILVQHLDPTHESLMVDLLASHTSLAVVQAADGMAIEAGHLYVIPPGTYLSTRHGALHLSEPLARHGARLAFDFLLHSLATEFGARAVAVVLTGTGADGSIGLRVVKENGGLVIAQEPTEAAYDGMPRSAIATGAVDMVLKLADIGRTLARYSRGMVQVRHQQSTRPSEAQLASITAIIALVRAETTHDFTHYKQGTLQRRIERRMAMSSIEINDMDRYLALLGTTPAELDLLAKDLLIHVTSFFRDPVVFALLAEQAIPDLVRNQPLDQPLRIWVAGCSTGEEAYSLTILFREAVLASKRNVKLQIFSSDIDPDAVAAAREGLYPHSIAADVTPERLERFFVKESGGYRVVPELRTVVVFTVQDILIDPPFSRLDFVSCRNLLIYLLPEAQAKIAAMFHFALRPGGILLLGNAETVGQTEGRFDVVSKSARIYRHSGANRTGEVRFPLAAPDAAWPHRRREADQVPSRPAALAEICRRIVLETYAPAAVLINNKQECLYFMGPTDRYLRVAAGHAMQDLPSMARDGVRSKLRAAIQQATPGRSPVTVTGGRTTYSGATLNFGITVHPIQNDGQDLKLVCFTEEPTVEQRPDRAAAADDHSRLADLEHELDATRTELRGALRELEISSEEQKAINEEALSVSEEFQATNEELLTSKEELQSLNEELTALNGHLQETLETQRTTSNDLQNILYSTAVATIFLDRDLNIRFFTPATRLLFNIIPTDLGRPLADLTSLAADGVLLGDARAVLRTLEPIECEIQARTGAWYIRRILPYRTPDNGVDGVVITFVDSTERRRTADALAAAEHLAQNATLAKTRFLAAASHDLRQPLQTLALLQGLLGRVVEGDRAKKLVSRLDSTLGAMTSMLNALLDINQIEAGTVSAQKVSFPINDLLERLRGEFALSAHAQGLELHFVPCSLHVHSDPALLEQMLRNLLANAIKYTRRGKVLLGCRRQGTALGIEIWDSGIGIPADQLQQIFEEFHQIGNDARERSRGLGLGLSIVQRLGTLMSHPVSVRSKFGHGSVFTITVDVDRQPQAPTTAKPLKALADEPRPPAAGGTGVVLIIEDDPDVGNLLETLLKEEGHHVATAPDGMAALALVNRGAIRPDLILADFNLPNGMNGLEVTSRLRTALEHPVPVIILTGDISTETLRSIAQHNCAQLNKPVRLGELTHLIRTLLVASADTPLFLAAPASATVVRRTNGQIIYLVDDEPDVRLAVRSVLEEDGHTVIDFAACEAFLAAYKPGPEACLVLDANLPGMNGFALLEALAAAGHSIPAIMITGGGDVAMAVKAMKAGASDFIEKPFSRGDLLAGVARALGQSRDASQRDAVHQSAASHIASLTPRQREIMDLVLAGHPSKNIAADLGISQRTVENHRAEIMARTGAKSLPALARLALAAASHGAAQGGVE